MPKSASLPPATADSNAPANGKHCRTFHGIVLQKNLTVRRLCSELHVAAESLRAAYDEPGRLSVNAVLAFSELVGEEPEKVFADIHAEIKELRKKGPAAEAPKRSRTLKVKPKAAD
jgi:hypothetical protein